VTGDHYLLFSALDGRRYANPLVGGTQGLFRVIADDATGEPYPVTNVGGGIISITDGRLRFTPPVDSIANGIAVVTEIGPPMSPAPVPGGQLEAVRSRPPDPLGAVLSLDAFIDEIRAALGGPAPDSPILRRDDGPPAEGLSTPSKAPAGGKAGRVRRDGKKPVAPKMPRPEEIGGEDRRPGPSEAQDIGVPLSGGGPANPLAGGTALCYCGYFNLFLVMEQVPEDWWSWQHNNDMMWLWNRYMDIYRYVDDDGTFGDNDENEFCGWVDDDTLFDVYGYHWNGSLAGCITWWVDCPCCEIVQADIVFNPAYSWWENFSDTLGESGRILYRPVVLHELGHSWGMQRGDCVEDYNYDLLSVMHAYYHDVVEDGWGIHFWDAYAIRQDYDNQTAVIPRQDVGTESYYASSGLHNATTNASTYESGNTITVQNISVENMSNTASSDVRIRLWLSTNNIITESDYQMGSYWYWDSFETYWTGDLATTVPSVPPGEYYVGIIVTINGDSYSYDDHTFNNATFFYDTITVTPPAPPNDDCANAITVVDGLVPYDTTWATTDGSAHGSCQFDGQTYNDLWYRYTASCTGILTVTTCEDLGGSADYDTDLVVYTAAGSCPPSDAQLLGCNDDDPNNPCGYSPDYHSTVEVPVVAGNTYRIRVGGYQASSAGSGVLAVSCGVDCPWDLDGSGSVSTSDLLALLAVWGSDPGGPPDFDGDGNVGTSDLLALLGNWGACSE
jgi:hypothetical protein